MVDFFESHLREPTFSIFQFVKKERWECQEVDLAHLITEKAWMPKSSSTKLRRI